jgi:hypothetical protein
MLNKMSQPPVVRILNDCIYFDIVARALSEAFTDLGIQHEVVTAAPNDDDLYIVFTTHHLDCPLPKRYVSYNFEQLTTDKQWPPELFERFSRAVQVWDYSLENIRALKERHGIAGALHVPLGYARCMDGPSDPNNNNNSSTTIKPFAERKHDWLMLGSVGPRRREIVWDLTTAAPRLSGMTTNNCWGDALLRLYRDTRVGLNVHYYTGKSILEVHRIVPMIANRVFVVSERSDDAYYDDKYKTMVTFLDTKKTGNNNKSTGRAIAASLDIVNRLLGRDDVDGGGRTWIDAELERRRDRLVSECSYVDTFRRDPKILSCLIIS